MLGGTPGFQSRPRVYKLCITSQQWIMLITRGWIQGLIFASTHKEIKISNDKEKEKIPIQRVNKRFLQTCLASGNSPAGNIARAALDSHLIKITDRIFFCPKEDKLEGKESLAIFFLIRDHSCVCLVVLHWRCPPLSLCRLVERILNIRILTFLRSTFHTLWWQKKASYKTQALFLQIS